jgi:hypothetical protein
MSESIVTTGGSAELIRDFLKSMARGSKHSPAGVPRVMVRMARKALTRATAGRTPCTADVDDLVSELLLGLARKAQRFGGMAELAREWSAWSDARLEGTIRKMFFHLAVERSPSWDLVRGLRDLVRAAVERGLPEPTTRPETLLLHGKLHGRAVAQAIAWTRAQLGAAAGLDTNALTTQLLNDYQLTQSETVIEDGLSISEDQPCESEEARVAASLAQTLVRRLGRDGVWMLAWRDELGFRGLADALGLGLATVHARFRILCAQMKQIVMDFSATLAETRVAIERLRLMVSGR